MPDKLRQELPLVNIATTSVFGFLLIYPAWADSTGRFLSFSAQDGSDQACPFYGAGIGFLEGGRKGVNVKR